MIDKLKNKYGGSWNHKLILNEIRNVLKKHCDNTQHIAHHLYATHPIGLTKVAWIFMQKEVKPNKTYPL